jgi:cysteine desulfurase
VNVPGVMGLATAAAVAVERQATHAAKLEALRERLIVGVLAAVADAVVNGHPTAHLPGIAHLSFPGCEGDSLLMLLDARGIECSTGSACSAGLAQPSHVLIAMGAGSERARGSLRFSLGRTSTDADVDAVIEAIGPVVERARRAGLVSAR